MVWEPGKNDPPAAGTGGERAAPPVPAAARGEGTPELPQEVLAPQEEDEQQGEPAGDEVDGTRPGEGMDVEPPPAEADPVVPPAEADPPAPRQASRKGKRAASKPKAVRRQVSPKPQTPEVPVGPPDSPDQGDRVALTLTTRRGTAYGLSAEPNTPTLSDEKPPRVFQEDPSAT
jgi:hypothetical protein